MTSPIHINPSPSRGKSLDAEVIRTLPYAALRVAPDCGHSPLYLMSNYEEQPLFCGLCFFKDGWEGELPRRLHEYKVLADNGNPETKGSFMSHLFLAMGLKQPPEGANLREWRKARNERKTPLARGQFKEGYTAPAWILYPVASALWKLVGYQPPLGIVLAKAVAGAPEIAIAAQLETSLFNVNIRMAKAVRIAMRYLPRDQEERGTAQDGTGGDEQPGSEPPRAN